MTADIQTGLGKSEYAFLDLQSPSDEALEDLEVLGKVGLNAYSTVKDARTVLTKLSGRKLSEDQIVAKEIITEALQL